MVFKCHIWNIWNGPIYNIADSRKLDCLHRAQCSLLLNPSCVRTNLPFVNVWSTVPISGVLFQVLIDRVQKQVVSLVGSGLSSDLQALSDRRDVAILSLFYKYYYVKCPSELADLVTCVTVRSTPFSEQMYHHITNSHMCTTKFY